MSRKNSIHYHQYEKMKWPNGKIFYKCMLPNCAHYLPLAMLAVGRESLCWGGCNRLVTITKEDIENEIKKPLCELCRKERKMRREEMIGV